MHPLVSGPGQVTVGANGHSPLPDWPATFPDEVYRDIPGLCKVATLAEIESQGWSLNPGRYVGVADRVGDNGDFAEQLEELNEELELLNAEARELEARISENVGQLLNLPILEQT